MGDSNNVALHIATPAFLYKYIILFYRAEKKRAVCDPMDGVCRIVNRKHFLHHRHGSSCLHNYRSCVHQARYQYFKGSLQMFVCYATMFHFYFYSELDQTRFLSLSLYLDMYYHFELY